MRTRRRGVGTGRPHARTFLEGVGEEGDVAVRMARDGGAYLVLLREGGGRDDRRRRRRRRQGARDALLRIRAGHPTLLRKGRHLAREQRWRGGLPLQTGRPGGALWRKDRLAAIAKDVDGRRLAKGARRGGTRGRVVKAQRIAKAVRSTAQPLRRCGRGVPSKKARGRPRAKQRRRRGRARGCAKPSRRSSSSGPKQAAARARRRTAGPHAQTEAKAAAGGGPAKERLGGGRRCAK
jgi:hypothetical protein